MKPIIGIVPSITEDEREIFTNIDNIEAIKVAGGIPLVLPYMMEETAISQYITLIDGLYLGGGNDIDPSYFGEAPHPKLGEVNPIRDAFEWYILKKALAKDKPILGVCKGSQMINIVLGGDLYQDLESQVGHELIQHQQHSPVGHPSHNIDVVEGTKLYKIINKSTIKVNSRHHQAIRNPGKDIIVSSRSNDGVIESIESTTHEFVLGVQWHPENLLAEGDSSSQQILQSFIHTCKKK